MKNYQLQKETYMKTMWFIREYYSIKDRYESILGKSSTPDGQPRGTAIGDPTGQTAIAISELSTRLNAIVGGLETIPKEYRAAIFDNIVNRQPYPDVAGRKTWKKWRKRYVYAVAENMNWI